MHTTIHSVIPIPECFYGLSHAHRNAIQLLNLFLFLWYTAANLFIFSLAINVEKGTPPTYGYGLGRETYLTPSPWIFGVLFAIHLLFAGTILYTQWTEKGNELVIEGLGMYVLPSIFWDPCCAADCCAD